MQNKSGSFRHHWQILTSTYLVDKIYLYENSLILCLCFVDRCSSFSAFSFGHCVVCSFRFTDSDYSFGIFKLWLHTTIIYMFSIDFLYSIQHYVIKFVSDFRQVGGFLRVLRFPPPIKLTARYNFSHILMIEKSIHGIGDGSRGSTNRSAQHVNRWGIESALQMGVLML